MTETATARLFKHGRRQAVRLPKEFMEEGREQPPVPEGDMSSDG